MLGAAATGVKKGEKKAPSFTVEEAVNQGEENLEAIADIMLNQRKHMKI